ncbi:MAG: hypothetical protein ABSB49_02760 [Polyangia bacterium]
MSTRLAVRPPTQASNPRCLAAPLTRLLVRPAMRSSVALILVGLLGCANSDITEVGPGSGGGGVGGGGAGPGAGGAIAVSISSPVPGTSPGTLDGGTTQMVGCDGGDGCTCSPLNLAVLGKPGDWGANPDGDPPTALQDWLNSASSGTARADNIPNRVTLTPEFLAAYNVIILASLADDSKMGPWWTFSDDEVAAFQAWVENGGGVISLTGYASGDETAPNNQLLGFSGVTYNNDGVWGDCINWSICSCTGSMTVSDWIRTDPVIANLSTGVTLVGYENGHSINCPADGHVAAQVLNNNVETNALVGKLVGKGRVLAYGDEWITYTSQWTGAGDPSSTNPGCAGEMPQDQYQMAQFWYNMIHWSQPAADCFVIVDNTTPISVW